MSNWTDIARQVEARAGRRCEYCRMHQALQGATFHVEHIVPETCGGPSTLENLAWACPGCNLRKSDRQLVEDPDTGDRVPLFHPRMDLWTDHFRFDGYEIQGLTPTGRATVVALGVNHERRLQIRHAEAMFGFFPPEAD